MNRFWIGKPGDAEYRKAALRLRHMASQSMEFDEHNVEAGYRYTSAARCADGTSAAETPDDVRVYIPDSRPGSPLPHAPLEDQNGSRLSLMDLVKPGQWTLIAGDDGIAWVEAAQELSKTLGLPLEAFRIGHLDGDYRDIWSAWERYRQISRDGAILVRPDRFVAWRNPGSSSSPKSVVATVLKDILGR